MCVVWCGKTKFVEICRFRDVRVGVEWWGSGEERVVREGGGKAGERGGGVEMGGEEGRRGGRGERRERREGREGVWEGGRDDGGEEEEERDRWVGDGEQERRLDGFFFERNSEESSLFPFGYWVCGGAALIGGERVHTPHHTWTCIQYKRWHPSFPSFSY